MGLNTNEIKIRIIDRSNICDYTMNLSLVTLRSYKDSILGEKTWQLTCSSIKSSCKIERKVKIDKHETTFDHLDF